MTTTNNDVDELTMNVWENLPAPLDDIFVDAVLSFVTVADFLRLAIVSKHYYDIFHPRRSVAATKALAKLLQRDAVTIYQDEDTDGYIRFTEQLPTFGRCSPEESLQEDPLLVAQMRRAALGRRSLIHLDFHHPSLSSRDDTKVPVLPNKLPELMRNYKSHSPRALVKLARDEFYGFLTPNERYRALQSVQTEFLLINQSGVDIHCHWIDHEGQLVVRQGDCTPSIELPPDEGEHTPPIQLSFQVAHDANGVITGPPHIFCHDTYAFHTFAFSFQQGGPPFAIYQLRRSWSPSFIGIAHNQEWVRHEHAVAVLPGGKVEELHCDSSRQQTRRAVICSYQLCNRQIFAPQEEAITETPLDATQRNDPKESAKLFYGVHYPSIDDGLWRAGSDLRRSRLLGNPRNPLNYPSIATLVRWHYQVTQHESQNDDASDET